MGNGFKYKQFDYIGGSDWGSTTKERSTTVLKDMANWLVTEAKCGWVLDTSRNLTIDDITDVPFWNPNTRSTYGSSYDGVALFFKNEISKCRLFLCLQHARGSENAIAPKIPQDDLEGCLTWNSTSSGNTVEAFTCCSGIISSIVPPTSRGEYGEDFGKDFDTEISFLPSTATRVIGTIHRRGYLSYSSYVNTNSSGYAYAYRLFVTPYVIGFSGDYSTSGSRPVLATMYGGSYFCGRLFGVLAHTESSDQSHYGTLTCGANRDSNNTDFGTSNSQDYTIGYSNTYSVFSTYTSIIGISQSQLSYPTGTLAASCGFFSAVGRPIKPQVYTCNPRYWPASIYELSNLMSNIGISGQLRWTPIAVGVVSTDLNTYGVVPGDGFKGYLDTNLFRIGYPVTTRQLYDNGNFIGLNYQLVLGWDSDNEL